MWRKVQQQEIAAAAARKSPWRPAEIRMPKGDDPGACKNTGSREQGVIPAIPTVPSKPLS